MSRFIPFRRKAPALAIFALLVAGCSELAGQTPMPDADLVGRAHALDGDTVSMTFRLSGVDAFEGAQECANDGGCYRCGKLAQDRAARFLRGGNAAISLTGARTYGRPVATVQVEGDDLGETLIREGLAVPATRYLKSDPARAAAYVAAFEDAARGRRGVHAG